VSKREQQMPTDIVVFVGMPRSGSTTLYHHLEQHPSVCVPFRKETFYFSFHYDRGEEWYRDLYRDARPGTVCFDISPDYFFSEEALRRILEFKPTPKAILGVRDPVEWVLSVYNQRRTTDKHIPRFLDFLDHYDLTVAEKTTRLTFDAAFVSRMVNLYRNALGDNLLLYDFRLFAQQPLMVLNAIEAFAGVPRYLTPANFRNVRFNASNRRNSVALYALLSNERLISALHRLLPARSLRTARNLYYRAVAKRGIAHPDELHAPENRRVAEERFGRDREVIRSLFADHPLQRGSGASFIVRA
jgi:hypothetical protein